MKKLILISKTPIIIQIFKLISKKLNIKLEILAEAQIDHKVDIIIIDKEFIDDRFNILKTYTKRIGAITNEQLGFEFANDFTIPLPFLPSNLQLILEKEVQEIVAKSTQKRYVTSIIPDIDDINSVDDNEYSLDNDEEELDPALQYLDSLANGIAQDIDEESDESLVSFESLPQEGGVLDFNELSKLEKIIDPNILGTNYNKLNTKLKSDSVDEDEWLDLSSIIDEAIYEVNSSSDLGSNGDEQPIELTLNNYSLNQLAPLLNLLNQDIIDELTNGKEISLQLKLGENQNV